MKSKKNLIIVLLILCVLIAGIPLLVIKDSEFGGADGAAEDVISEVDPNYKAWASPVLEPPGGETESLLFCLQAAIGAGILGFGLGVLKERYKKENIGD